MKRLHAQLVSPPLPSGQSWLVNALLALDICTTGHGSFWQQTAQGWQMHPPAFREMLKWFLPVLHQRETFHFRESIEVFWDHQLAFAQYPQRKTILMVRDPRDAFYSHFRREVYENGYPDTQERLIESLCTPKLWVSPVSLPMMLPAADITAYFCLSWMQQLPPEQLLVVRYEDTRSDPAGQLQKVLNFLGLQRSADEIKQAVAASEITQARAANQKMEKAAGTQRLLSRAGQAGEWKTKLPTAALSHFAGPAEKMIRLLGYEPLNQSSPQPSPALLQAARPLLEAFARGLQQHAVEQVQSALREQIQATPDPELQNLLAGQLLAMLWVRVILRQGLMHTPMATRLMLSLASLNLEFSACPQIRQAAGEILDPAHPLYHLSPRDNVFVSNEADFGQAAAAALASGQALFFWNPARLRLTHAGFMQLRELLDGRNPRMLVVTPVLDAPEQHPDQAEGSHFGQRAYLLHASQGGEYRQLHTLPEPPCLMIWSGMLAWLPKTDLASLLGHWPIFEACGVLAQRPQMDPQTAQS